MKVLTVFGTRPEIIRLSRVIERLDAGCDQVLVYTGQNFEPALSDVFFQELGVRKPDYVFNAKGSFAQQLGIVSSNIEQILVKERPDAFLVLGDTNSSLSAICAKRMGFRVYHMEAGNRCYDDRVPEEVNRGIVDRCSDVLLPYTQHSRRNLLAEGFPPERIIVTGNPILEVIRHCEPLIHSSKIIPSLGLEAGKYILVTAHRSENVDIEWRLRSLMATFSALHDEHRMPVIISTHPRMRSMLEKHSLSTDVPGVRFLQPFGFFDFIQLERNAWCAVSDSGTVQEECAIFGVPLVTIRDVTERPETVECGSNIVAGVEMNSVAAAVRTAVGNRGTWTPPEEYLVEDVSERIARILLGPEP